MKKIITMVGTSIFENYFQNNRDDIVKMYYDDLRDKPSKDYDNEGVRTKKIKESLPKWINKVSKKEDVSAEIKSILKIKELIREPESNIEVYLLCSDTCIGKLAGEIVKEVLKNNNFPNVYLDVLSGLQVESRDEFLRKGMINLIYKIYTIANYDWENIVINITGGYKATIPYLTILAQINRVPIYYIFEATNALIEIPYIPIDIRWSIFEKNEKFFLDIEEKGIKELSNDVKNNKDILSLIEIVDNIYCLNPLGISLWEKYIENFEMFYVSDEVENYLKKYPDRNKLFEKSVLELIRRLNENPNDRDLHHVLSFNPPVDFDVFKHKEDKCQVRILYKAKKYKTYYGFERNMVYIALFAACSEVHNSESEYVEYFSQNVNKVKDIEKYRLQKIYKIKGGLKYV